MDQDFSAPSDTSNRGPTGLSPIVRIMWIAMIGSVFTVTAVGLLVPGLAKGGDPNWVLVGALGSVSMLILGLVAFAESWLAPRTPSYMSYAMVRWAMCDSVSIYGLVLHILGAPIWVLPSFAVLSLLGMLLASPTQADFERWEQTKAQ